MSPARAQFMTILAAGLQDGERLEVRALLPGLPAITCHCRTPREVDQFATLRAAHRNVYMGVVPRDASGQGTAEHCTAARVLWAEIDFKTFADLPDPRAAAERAIAGFPLRFALIVCSSGGFHVYVALTAAADVRNIGTRRRVESLNAWVGRALAGQGRPSDHVQDTPRILRLPDTWNHKTTPPKQVTLEQYEPAATYSLDAVEAALRTHYPWAERTTEATGTVTPHLWHVVDAPPRDLRERAARGRIRRDTLALLDTTGGDRYGSASEADAAIAAGLIGAGLTADEALALLVDSVRGQDAMRRKGEKHGEYYLRRTVEHAAGFVGPVIETPHGRMREARMRRPRPFVEVGA